MIALNNSHPKQPDTRGWQKHFLALLPDLRRAISFAFRWLEPEAREDAEEEAVAAALVAYHRLVELNKTDVAYAGPLARYAVAHVRSGRRVGCPINSKDVMSEYAQQRRGFRVQQISTRPREDGVWQDLLLEDKRTSPAEVAALRIDFPAWLSSLTKRDRSIAVQLALGERNKAVARQFGLSQPRISQLREFYLCSWRMFHGEAPVPLAETSRRTNKCSPALTVAQAT